MISRPCVSIICLARVDHFILLLDPFDTISQVTVSILLLQVFNESTETKLTNIIMQNIWWIVSLY